MTRKEEREQASNLVFKIRLCPRTAFIRGAEWADQHPREGLWDAQKVIEWLNSVDFSKYVEDLSVVYVGRLKDDLIKAIEK